MPVINSPPGAGDLVYDSGLATGATASYNFNARQFSKLDFSLYLATAFISPQGLTLTGVSGSKYLDVAYVGVYGGAGANNPALATQTGWVLGGTSPGPGTVYGNIILPPAPELKRYMIGESDATAGRIFAGHCTDTAVDPTGFSFALSASGTYRLRVWGWP